MVLLNIQINNILAALPRSDGFSVETRTIYISGGVIASVGEKPEGFLADREISGENRFAIPGLINSHTHAYMSLLRGCADDMPFNDWLFNRVLPLEEKLEGEDFYWGTMLAVCEMVRGGATAYMDMYIAPEHSARAAHDSGMRAVLTRGLIGDSRGDEGGLRRLREAERDMDSFAGCDRLTFMLAPHAPYTCSPDYLGAVAERAGELGIGIHTHIAESAAEIETIRERYHCTPVEMLEKAGLFDAHTAAAHCVFLTDSDIDIFHDKNVSVLTNPVSNMKLGNGFAPVPKLLKKGVNVALGTDSAASNNNLNMLRELGYLTLVHKGQNRDAVSVSAAQGLGIATKNGAKALALENTGELKAGMKADLAILDLNSVTLNPRSDLISALAYAACGSEVETVIADGRILMENRELKTVDEGRVIFEANRIYERIKTK